MACGDGGMAGASEAVVLGALVGLAEEPFVELDGSDDGEMGRLEQEDASPAEFVVGGQEEAERPEDDKSEQIEWRVEVSQTVTSRRLQHVDAVDIEILLSSVGNNSGETVGQHTRQGAGQKDGAEGDEDDHKWWAENGVNVMHYVEANVARTVENFGQEPSHVLQGINFAANERECRQKAQIDDDDKDHELDEVFAHLSQAWDKGLKLMLACPNGGLDAETYTPVRAQAEY